MSSRPCGAIARTWSASASSQDDLMKRRDPILEDLHKLREKIGRAHDFDVHRIAATVRRLDVVPVLITLDKDFGELVVVTG
jgi:hypothetical protein